MTIYINYDNDLDTPENPLLVDRGEQKLEFSYCYAEWWGTSARKKPGRIRTFIGYSLTDGQVVTLQNAVKWMREVAGLDARLIKGIFSVGIASDGDYRKTIEKNAERVVDLGYAIELQYDPKTMPANQLYYALCHTRFPSKEYTDPNHENEPMEKEIIEAANLLPENASYRQLLTSIFSHNIFMVLHMPFQDYSKMFGNNFNNKDVRPKVGPELGKALYAFYEKQRDRDWGDVMSSTSAAAHNSGIYTNEWLPFYVEWYNTDDRTKEY